LWWSAVLFPIGDIVLVRQLKNNETEKSAFSGYLFLPFFFFFFARFQREILGCFFAVFGLVGQFW
jgi:hypothetical protein